MIFLLQRHKDTRDQEIEDLKFGLFFVSWFLRVFELKNGDFIRKMEVTGRTNDHISFALCLRITGKDLDPDQITERLGMEPDNCHRAGDPYIKNTVWQYGRWQCGLTGELGEPLDELIDEFLMDFECKEDELKAITRQHDAVLSIGMCYLTQYVYAPCLDISSGIIKKLGDLGLAIDVTAYPST